MQLNAGAAFCLLSVQSRCMFRVPLAIVGFRRSKEIGTFNTVKMGHRWSDALVEDVNSVVRFDSLVPCW